MAIGVCIHALNTVIVAQLLLLSFFSLSVVSDECGKLEEQIRIISLTRFFSLSLGWLIPIIHPLIFHCVVRIENVYTLQCPSSKRTAATNIRITKGSERQRERERGVACRNVANSIYAWIVLQLNLAMLFIGLHIYEQISCVALCILSNMPCITWQQCDGSCWVIRFHLSDCSRVIQQFYRVSWVMWKC